MIVAPHWRQYASRARGGEEQGDLDVYSLLKTLLDNWSELFRYDDGLRKARSFISIAMDARNAVAHFAGNMTERQALRYLDAMRELLSAVGAQPKARIVEALYDEQRGAGGKPVARKTAAPSRSGLTMSGTVRGKYAPLHDHLSTGVDSPWHATFGEIEAVLGFDLPASARRYPAWWANENSGGRHSHARAWKEAGWKTAEVNIEAEELVFRREGSASNSPKENRG
ncbi:MAG: Swt1 family HEPN domain-containing protein [Alphaproteobacteria bacterium]|nr:Swt1 family HEPN domain-containing protein [Alphaproteobacteria bacterium]